MRNDIDSPTRSNVDQTSIEHEIAEALAERRTLLRQLRFGRVEVIIVNGRCDRTQITVSERVER